MKILVIGSGGREHALVWRLKKTSRVRKVFAAPGNAGIGLLANLVNIKADNIKGLANFAEKNRINLTVVGPEVPLATGIVDEFNKRKLRIFGPTKKAAEIESCKAFAKEFMRKYHIPTAPFQTFTEAPEAVSFVQSATMPVVIKASGLAAGKGAVVVEDRDEAIRTIENMMTKKIFGAAGSKVVIETYLEGQELSVMAFTDGRTARLMLPSQDHKQIGEGDTGPNTGGMGAYCPADFFDKPTMDFIREQIIERTIQGLAKEGRKYQGVLYAGLMLTATGPKVVEFNCRFGDPEAQAVLPLLKTDLTEILMAVTDNKLSSIKELKWHDGAAACVVLASKGYPGKYKTGRKIQGLRNYSDKKTQLFHAGTRREGRQWLTAGGRVIGVTSMGKDLSAALNTAYGIIGGIKFEGKTYRGDIGHKAKVMVRMEEV